MFDCRSAIGISGVDWAIESGNIVYLAFSGGGRCPLNVYVFERIFLGGMWYLAYYC